MTIYEAFNMYKKLRKFYLLNTHKYLWEIYLGNNIDLAK